MKGLSSLIWFTQQTLQTKQNALNIVHCGPFVFQDVQAYSTGEVHVRMVDWSLEENGGWCVRVVRGKLKGELECETGVRCIIRSRNGGRPQQ